MAGKKKFIIGDEVEIESKEEGFGDSWFEAKILPKPKPHKKKKNKIYVEYHRLLEKSERSPLRECVYYAQIRPIPPKEASDGPFGINDEVDAFCRDGWWKGVITKIVGAKYSVMFENFEEELELEMSDLRRHLDWIGGKWLSSQEQEKTEPVEIRVDDETCCGAWFPATILEKISDSFLVTYTTLRFGGKTEQLKEIVDTLHIRPSPPHMSKDKRFDVLEKVDAFYDFGWWSGVVTQICAADKYIVFFKHHNKQKKFKQSDLRLHMDWIDGKWILDSEEAEFIALNEGTLDAESNPKNKHSSSFSREITFKKVRERLVTKNPTFIKACSANGRRSTEAKGVVSYQTAKGTENASASKEMTDVPMECTPLLTRMIQEHQPVSTFTKNFSSQQLKDTRDKENEDLQDVQIKHITMSNQIPIEYHSVSLNLEKCSSPITKDNGGPEHEAATVERTRSQMLSHNVEEHQTLALCPEHSNSPVVDDTIGIEHEALTVERKKCDHMPSDIAKKHQPLSSCPEQSGSPGVKDIIDSTGQYLYGNGNANVDEGAMQTADMSTKTIASPMQQDEWPLLQDGSLPFVKNSPLWGTIESLKVFHLHPQHPHFRPLEEQNEELREGFAIGSMMSFANLVEGTWNANLEEPRSMFESKISALTYLGTLGFTVQPIQTRLEELLMMKDTYDQLEERSKAAKNEFIEEKRKVDKLEVSLTQLNMKMQALVSKKKMKSSAIAALHRTADTIKANIHNARREFDSVIASPLVSNAVKDENVVENDIRLLQIPA